jgi:hypothetical protein
MYGIGRGLDWLIGEKRKGRNRIPYRTLVVGRTPEMHQMSSSTSSTFDAFYFFVNTYKSSLKTT